MATNAKAERKYLERHAEPESRIADQLDAFGHALVIPAYGEGDELLRALASVPRGPLGPVLVVLVVNGKASAPEWVHQQNRELLGRLRETYGDPDATLSRDPPATLRAFGPGRLLTVDRSAPAHWFPDDQGVGLARKIGVDVCVRLHAAGRLASPFLHTTDADVELPADYFARAGLSTDPEPAAVLYPFSHVPVADPALARAVLLYEISLRYYVLGLSFAGSPYAHHTIGSTIAVGARAYAEVRGFPKRAAAEDFYLLSKVAKVGPIAPLGGRPIAIGGRSSSRVPFGTGAAVGRIAALGAAPFTVYHPQLFRHLRAWLGTLARLELGSTRDVDRQVGVACVSEEVDTDVLLPALRALGAHDAIASAEGRCKTTDALRRHLATWFDAFRTLKLLHALRRAGLEQRPWLEALRSAPFARAAIEGVGQAEPDLDELRGVAGRLAAMEVRSPPEGQARP